MDSTGPLDVGPADAAPPDAAPPDAAIRDPRSGDPGPRNPGSRDTGGPGGPSGAIGDALRVVRENLGALGRSYPDDTTDQGRYRLRSARDGHGEGANIGWTTSFWPGMLWLAFELTGDEVYRQAAAGHVASFADRASRRIDVETHDLGFLYTLSCVAAWRLTGDPLARSTALVAADLLMTRYLPPAGIVQAWGGLDDPRQRGRTIIDSLMNMPLLYWAGEESGDARFATAAHRHAGQLRDHIIRADDSTFHTFSWNPVTGEPLYGDTEQGSRDDSCWARGQAWGIYGFALNFRYTGDPTLLRAARRCASYFVDHLPDDRVAYWDLVFRDGSRQPRDSSAAAIAVCGLDELTRCLPPGPQRERYRRAAAGILASLAAGYAARDGSAPGPLLLHGVYDLPKAVGVDEGNLWGDYFYLEALTRAALPARRGYW